MESAWVRDFCNALFFKPAMPSRWGWRGGGCLVGACLERASGELSCGLFLPRPLAMAQVRQLERSIALKDLALAEMEHTIQEMEAASYDGVFIWKIMDFARKRQEAIAGRSPAIFSPGSLPQMAFALRWETVPWGCACGAGRQEGVLCSISRANPGPAAIARHSGL